MATCSAAGLDRLLHTGNADFIVAEMGIFSLVGFSAWVATLAVLLSTFRWINDRHRQVQGSVECTQRGTQSWSASTSWSFCSEWSCFKKGPCCSAHHPHVQSSSFTLQFAASLAQKFIEWECSRQQHNVACNRGVMSDRDPGCGRLLCQA